MKRKFREFQKKSEYLLCVDSDGSAMNTMDVKHMKCFGPQLVETWGLEEYRDSVLKVWNEVNLYSMTRGINRFLGLGKVLEYIDRYITPIEDLDSLKKWIESTSELSNASLIRYMEDNESPILYKTLSWSQTVSLQIGMLPVEERCPFDGVAEALLASRDECDIVVVSEANPDAMSEEWELHGLAYYVDMILNQNIGSKKFCVAGLVEKGYEPSKVIMIGDAMEDLEVARECGVCFYPIINRREVESWHRFDDEALAHFYAGTYVGPYQEQLIEEFTQAFHVE